MVDRKRRHDQNFGHLTSLEYFPPQTDKGGTGTLNAGRRLFDNPKFQLLRPFETVNPAPKFSDVRDEPLNRKSKRVQKRWLKNAHSEACWATGVISEVLNEEAEIGKSEEQKLPAKPSIVLGEITDARRPKEAIAGTPALAMSAGESGQILRILRLTEEQWRWGKHDDAFLNSWKLAPSSSEDELFWARDAIPITRIKFATDLKAGAPYRWLIVQKRTSTTILRPTYHSVPVPVDSPALPDRQASRVEPVEILSLGIDRTGGNAHSDVSFNPRRHSLPSQLAVIDECGYWSVWNISGKLTVDSTVFRASLYKCGHFGHGSLSSLAMQPRRPPEPFGLLWCSPSASEPDDWDVELLSAAESDITAKPNSSSRSRTLVLWNQTTLQVIDSEDGVTYSAIPVVTTKGPTEVILDVKTNVADNSQILVLTTKCLHWIDVCPSGEDVRDVPPSILRSFLHENPSSASVELSTSYEADSTGRLTGLAFVYACDDGRLSLFWLFNATDATGSTQFHHQLQFLDRSRDAEADNLHQLVVVPLRLRRGASVGPDGSPGAGYVNSGVQFFQVLRFGRRASLEFSISAITRKHAGKLLPPARTRNPVWKRWEKPKRQRQVYLGYMMNKFVLPRNLADFESLGTGRAESSEGPLEFRPWPGLDQKAAILRRVRPCRLLDAFLASVAGSQGMFFPHALENLRQLLVEGDLEQLPLQALPECIDHAWRDAELSGQEGLGPDDLEWTHELGQVLESNLDVAVDSVHLGADGTVGVAHIGEEFLATQKELSEVWSLAHSDLAPSSDSARRWAILRMTGRDVLLSHYTLRTMGMSSTQQGKNPVPSSSFPTESDWDAPPSSQTARRRRVAEKQQSALQALQRLSDLVAEPVSHSKKLSKRLQHSILSRWDDALDASYTPFLIKSAVEVQEQLMERKARVEERRERSRQTKDEFRRLMALETVPASQPVLSMGRTRPMPVRIRPTAFSSSQPVATSSQDLLPASQPVSGLFAQRRPAKRRRTDAFGGML